MALHYILPISSSSAPKRWASAFLLCSLLLPLSSSLLPAQDRIVPRHPSAIELPELGRTSCESCGFGREIYPLPDVNNDSLADFLTTVIISDTGGWGANATELRLYKGVHGGLPDIENYLRIGPSEIGSNTKFLAAGDWDADGNEDLAVAQTIFGDTSFGSTPGFTPSRVVIWWGNTHGTYSLADTTHLENGTVAWLTPDRGFVLDLNVDGVDDLLLFNIRGVVDGAIEDLADVVAFTGTKGEKWGKAAKAGATWEWWDAPNISQYTILAKRFQIIDQDHDGLEDIVMYQDARNNVDDTWVKIIYGRKDMILDTANIVEIDLRSSNGKYSLFSDITGDRVPELLVATGGEETLRAYVGFKGQRIEEQYGNGDEPSKPGEELWWGKPWANIPLVNKLHDGWATAGWGPIYPLGDGGLDGVDDLWVLTVPDIVFYNGGLGFDSLYDGWINFSDGIGSPVVVGNIDGTGNQTIAIPTLNNATWGIKFVQPSTVVPTGGIYRMAPPGTDTVLSGMRVEGRGRKVVSSLGVQAVPNPASGVVRVMWGDGDRGTGRNGDVVVRVTDVRGQKVKTFTLPAYEQETLWDASKTFGGTYFITVTIGDVSETTKILRR